MDYDAFMSRSARRRGPNQLSGARVAFPSQTDDPDGLLCLTSGLPHVDAFPLKGLTLTLANGTNITLSRDELLQAQQYWDTAGLKGYAEVVNSLVKQLHDPPCWDKLPNEGKTRVYPMNGATDSYFQVLHLMMDEGDTIITEEVTFPGFNAEMQAMGLKPLPVVMDQHGMIPESLVQALSRWDPEAPPGVDGKPKLMYIIPNGQNPTGATYTLERKKAIFEIAQKYNFIIYEDDPYFLLTFTERCPSFLALDTDGRVIRADSFSKTLAPGLRGGYMSGPAPLMTKVLYQISVSSCGTSALSQVIIAAIINKFGIEGFLQQAQRTTDFYRKQRDAMVHYADKWLKGLVEYSVPESGLCVWMKIKGVEATHDLMLEKGSAAGVVVVPGKFFSPINEDGPFFRVTYSIYAPEFFDKAFQRLAALIEKHATNHQV